MSISNIVSERKYSAIASRIEDFMAQLISEGEFDMKNLTDRLIMNSLNTVHAVTLDIAISFDDKKKENA